MHLGEVGRGLDQGGKFAHGFIQKPGPHSPQSPTRGWGSPSSIRSSSLRARPGQLQPFVRPLAYDVPFSPPYSSESLRRAVYGLFRVRQYDIRVARGSDDHRCNMQILARGPLLPFRPYRVVLFATDVDILDLRQFLKRANLRHAGAALREPARKLRRESLLEVERLLERFNGEQHVELASSRFEEKEIDAD